MLLRIASLAALGGFLFGYDLGLIGGAMLGISKTFSITSDSTKEAIVGAAKFGAFFGTFIGGALMLRYGRRMAIALEAVFFVLGPVLMAAATGPGMLVVGRLVVGLGVGGSAIVVPAYLAEIAPAKHRGAVVQMYEMMLTLGLLSSVLVDAALSSAFGAASAWRWMVGLPAIPGVVMAASLVMLPESPRWLVLRGDLDQALDIIHQVLQSRSSRQQQDGSNNSSSRLGEQGEAQGRVFTALNQAEDELLLLWSSVEKDKDAVRQRQLELRASRDGRAAAAACDGIAPAAGGVPSASDVQQLRSQQLRPQDRLHAGEQQQQQQGLQFNETRHIQGQHDVQQEQQQHLAEPCNDRESGQRGTAAATVETAAAGTKAKEHTAAAAVGGLGSTEGSSDSRCTSRRTTFASIDGDLCEEEARRSWLQPGHSRGTMGTLSGERHSSQERLLPFGHVPKAWAQEEGAARGLEGWAEEGRGLAGKWEAARASLRAWWEQQQQQWVEGPGWGSGNSTVNAAGRGSAGYTAAPGPGRSVVGVEGVVTGRGSIAGEVEPGLEKSFWHTLWAMLRDMYAVVKGPERKAFAIAATLAVLDQATASTAVINYAPEVLSSQLGITSERNAILYPAVIAVTKCIGVAIALALVDDLGRRQLLISGGIGCGIALFGAAAALGSGSVVGFLTALCLFIFCFSLSWAGLYWVVVAEVFSMTAKSPASSAATSLLFLTGSVVNLVFLSMLGGLGRWAFVVFGAIALASAWYVFRAVPETKGKTLAEIQALLQGLGPREGSELTDEGGSQHLGLNGASGSSLKLWEEGVAWLKRLVRAKGGEVQTDTELVGLVVDDRHGDKQGGPLGAASLDEAAGDNAVGGSSHGQQLCRHEQQQQQTEQKLTGGEVGGSGAGGAGAGSSRRAGVAYKTEAPGVALKETRGGYSRDPAVGALQDNVAYYQQQAWQRQHAAAAAAAATGLGLGGGGLMLPLGQELRPDSSRGGARLHSAPR